MTRDYLASLPSDRFPHLVELADHITAANADQRFELLLDLFVDGLAARATAASSLDDSPERSTANQATCPTSRTATERRFAPGRRADPRSPRLNG
jgi:hypothetical protein